MRLTKTFYKKQKAIQKMHTHKVRATGAKPSWSSRDIMKSLKSTLQSYSSEPIFCFLKIDISLCIRPIKCTTTHEIRKRFRKTFQSNQDKKLTCAQEMYCQKRLTEHNKCRKLLAFNPDHLMALNIKECLLKVQQLYLKQLAAKENHVKRVAKILCALTIEFEKNQKEVKRVIEGLWSLKHTVNHYSNGC